VKVLIVEDDSVGQSALEAFMRRQGCWTDAASNAEAAMLRLKVSVPDAVVTDHLLTANTGLDLVRQMRQLPATAAVPAVMITAIDDDLEVGRIEAELEKQGHARLIRKPFEPADLVRAVRQMAGK
jgi:CheY-like chemotaxis protein